jgi:hypothetical protein
VISPLCYKKNQLANIFPRPRYMTMLRPMSNIFATVIASDSLLIAESNIFINDDADERTRKGYLSIFGKADQCFDHFMTHLVCYDFI